MGKLVRIILRSLYHAKFIIKVKLLFTWLFQNALKLGLLSVLCFFLLKSDLSFQLQFNASPGLTGNVNIHDELSLAQSLVSIFDHSANEADPVKAKPKDDNLSNDYSNMTYNNTSQLSKKSVSGVEKKQKQMAYVNRFADVARSEMRKYGIPASITLAQGLIESNAGESRLSRENNNHFGMKCFSKSCKKGHCRNFTDDSHKDFFRVYGTAWESFRAHSIMLNGKRYQHLKQIPATDYQSWSHGLKKAGYATDKHYAEKLIHIIEELELYRFDH